jgi:hypothetical protein
MGILHRMQAWRADSVQTPERAPKGRDGRSRFSEDWWPLSNVHAGRGGLISAMFVGAFLFAGRGLAFAVAQSGWSWMFHKIYGAVFG